MKRSLLVLALLVFGVTAAFGETLDGGIYTIDVPDGWYGSVVGPTAIITKNDNSGQVSVAYASRQGYSLGDLAAALVQEFSKNDAFSSVGTPEADDDGDYVWDMTTANGTESKALLREVDDNYLLVVRTGQASPDEVDMVIGGMNEK